MAAIAVSSNYYEDDVIGPIADALLRQRGFTQSQLGMLNGIISVPNIVLAFFSGLLIDRVGASRVALWAAATGVAGAVLTAVGTPYSIILFGSFIFGISEGAIFIALIAGLAHWFARGGIALAMAIFLSLARLGSHAVYTSTRGRKPCMCVVGNRRSGLVRWSPRSVALLRSRTWPLPVLRTRRVMHPCCAISSC